MESLVRDVRAAVRMLLANRASTAVVVLSLAVGIGANSAIFSVVDALLLRPLPYADADRLVILWQRSPGLNVAQDWFSPAQANEIRTQCRSFEESAVAIGASFNMTGVGEPERVDAAKVTSTFFPLLGARPLLGRVFAAEDDAPGAPPSVVLGNGFWRRRFGADPGVVGRTVTLNGAVYTIVGVMPETFTLNKEVLVAVYGIRNADVLLPLPFTETDKADRGHEDYLVYARLAPGVTLDQAQAELDGLAARMRAQFPENYPPSGGLTISAVPLLEQVVGDVRSALTLLFGAVGLVLVTACANVANVLLASGASRRKELAVRTAVGASRARIVRQLLTESVVLALAGGGVGLAVAVGGVAAIRALGPGTLPRLAEIGLDWRVLVFTVAVAVATGVAFGLVPALRASRVDLTDALKEGGRSAGGAHGGHQRLRRALIVSEVALSALLLVGAGLLVRSYVRVSAASPGFDPKNVLSMRISLPASKYTSPELANAFFGALHERVVAIPGVESAGMNFLLPLTGSAVGWGPIVVDGYVPREPRELVIANERFVSPDYLTTMRIPVVEGRGVAESDRRGAQPVSLVNEAFARRFWPGESPLGKRVARGDTGEWRTVVGVVRDDKELSVDEEPEITVYHPVQQVSPNSRYLVVRTTADPRQSIAAVAGAVHAIDPDLPVYDVATMEDRLASALGRRRFATLVLATLAGVAVALAAIGIYGVLAYSVHVRTHEIGVRVAVGARPADVVRLVAVQSLAMVAIGTAVGLFAALALSRTVEHLLFEIPATDAATYAAVPLLVAAVAAAATLAPALRATRVDPVVALREE